MQGVLSGLIPNELNSIPFFFLLQALILPEQSLRAFNRWGSCACSTEAGIPPHRDCLLPGEIGNAGLQNPFDKSEVYDRLILFNLKLDQHAHTV